MRMTLKVTVALALAVPVLALAACGGGSAASGPQDHQPASAASLNPVSILKKMGVPTSAVYGQVDIWGDRYASGNFPGGEQVTVYTFADRAAQQADNARNSGGASTDSNVVITGPGWKAVVTGALNLTASGTSTITFEVSPAMLAQRAGGTVVPGRV